MRILYLNPFHAGSHAAVAEGFARHSRHQVTLLSLSQAGGWRWRMRGAAVTLARMLREQHAEARFDLVLATDMLDLATFLGLAGAQLRGARSVLYFHENQLTYPLPPGRTRDLAFPWINYTGALAADAVCFNSAFHQRALLAALPELVGRYHDHQERDLIDTIAAKAHVLPPGIDLARLDLPGAADRSGELEHEPSTQAAGSQPPAPVILWNSRWEYDKGPAEFFEALRALDARGVDFRLVALGEHIDPREPHFLAARAWLGERALAWGYAPDLAAYRARLRQSEIVVSCALQEFFGISVIEAIYCGCVPLLPRRLSYPELLPPALHADYLYEAGTLAERLADTIARLPELRRRDLRALAAPYDWAALAPRYDALFEQIAG